MEVEDTAQAQFGETFISSCLFQEAWVLRMSVECASPSPQADGLWTDKAELLCVGRGAGRSRELDLRAPLTVPGASGHSLRSGGIGGTVWELETQHLLLPTGVTSGKS